MTWISKSLTSSTLWMLIWKVQWGPVKCCGLTNRRSELATGALMWWWKLFANLCPLAMNWKPWVMHQLILCCTWSCTSQRSIWWISNTLRSTVQQLLAACVSLHIRRVLLLNIVFYLLLWLITLTGMDHSNPYLYCMHQISLVLKARKSYLAQTL